MKQTLEEKRYIFNCAINDTILCPPDKNRKWYVFHTKSRREKKIAEFCLNENIHFFLPLEKRITYSGKRKHIFYPPLFPGYFFCCINWEERYNLYTTNNISYTLNVKNQDRLIKDLYYVKRVLDEDIDLFPVNNYEPGVKVRITSGPFAGFEGEIISVKNKKRIVLEIECLNRLISLEVAPESIEKIN